jgi:hypothetical protein
MLPLRQRLREPNDVHHSFRETAPAMRQGPNLLSVGPLPAAVMDVMETTEESSYTTTTFEEDLFLIDKVCVWVGGWVGGCECVYVLVCKRNGNVA